MATRFASSLLRRASQLSAGRRCISTQAASRSGLRWRALAVAAGVAGAAGYTYFKEEDRDFSLLQKVHAAFIYPESQPSVYSGTKTHALYLWIHLSPNANARACAKAVAGLQHHVDEVSPPSMKDEDDEIIAGVGFGPKYFAAIGGKPKQNYEYPDRTGSHGSLPSTGGDIFIHAKSNDFSKLFELADLIVHKMPAGSVDKYEDVYGWVYKNGRDLTGFIDGTENPADDEERREVAVEIATGGSYVITQRWEHKLDVIRKEKAKTKEEFVGRSLEDSMELKNKPITSHVARMTGGAAFEQKKVFRIVRQSQPYGNLHDKAGLFFIAYAASPQNFEYMLKRMVGKGEDKHSDNIMKLTTCKTGTYWYFPGKEELKKFQ